MGKQSHRRRDKRKRAREEKLREYHHNHTKRRIRLRHGLVLGDEELEDIILLIRKGRDKNVWWPVGDGGRRNGAFVYIVVFRGFALPVIYHPAGNWLVTCLKMEWVFRKLPEGERDKLKEWLRLRLARGKKESGGARTAMPKKT